ncbi:hypothetical protein Asp14428_51470 [Actinoplanes sp. NBRC 14428]|uniref:Copper(I)-binding protein n=1 Tax=Pseudosporangium ferrugineum TaxID=439699 RepID=A0A2T0S618_9ACTN|nr:hypothetical protein [Pseudosporangium ferrugineum]PRY28868.1 hypothetical protein CLV70_107173 [Pseudosporangium ferrugineum]BCJ53672.1 hypothetical protein Asp14428_51470 [Actinoplanes sp. NBRC 14428]
MRSLGTRRAFLATGVATVAAVALAACSAGQVAETALKRPSNPGVNADNSNGSVVVRNLSVQYPGVEGYKAGESAPLELGLYNQTTEAITVLVSSQPLSGATEKQGVVSARQVGLVGGTTPSAASTAIPEPSGSRPSGNEDDQNGDQVPSRNPSSNPSPGEAPSGGTTAPGAEIRPARIEIGPLGSVAFLPGDREQLQVIGLTGKLAPGTSVNLVFEFSNGAQPLVVQAPVSIPLSPAPRATGDSAEDHEGE